MFLATSHVPTHYSKLTVLLLLWICLLHPMSNCTFFLFYTPLIIIISHCLSVHKRTCNSHLDIIVNNNKSLWSEFADSKIYFRLSYALCTTNTMWCACATASGLATHTKLVSGQVTQRIHHTRINISTLYTYTHVLYYVTTSLFILFYQHPTLANLYSIYLTVIRAN